MNNYFFMLNGETVPLSSIPTLDYTDFFEQTVTLLEDANKHCVIYYAYPSGGGGGNDEKLKFICVIANDATNSLFVYGHESQREVALKAISAVHYSMHIFEREIYENYGVIFSEHTWLKPVRYAHNRAIQTQKINDYPFYSIESEELHEVGVGPIHAGVIEPGHFRFICNGEKVLHLEIQLGWQHRGVEQLFLTKKQLLQKNILAESIAGDTAVGHNLTFCHLIESLAGITVSPNLSTERAIALELERIAVHIGDLSAMFTDVAYQLGSAVFNGLRTPIINFTQLWCGNRFGKSLVRVGGSHYPLTPPLVEKLLSVLADFEIRYSEMADFGYQLPSVLSRFEGCGTVTKLQAQLMGLVGMCARMCNIPRDVRVSHPIGKYKDTQYDLALQNSGDVFARGMIRVLEIQKSIDLIREWVKDLATNTANTAPLISTMPVLAADSFCLVLTEGWRGEIAHAAVTDSAGSLHHYKVKDPSVHNWLGLAIAVRNQEISDFPINNKSFDLSYCGHDL
jgi:Ni,Fe-hydrogenase III large subunit